MVYWQLEGSEALGDFAVKGVPSTLKTTARRGHTGMCTQTRESQWTPNQDHCEAEHMKARFVESEWPISFIVVKSCKLVVAPLRGQPLPDFCAAGCLRLECVMR